MLFSPRDSTFRDEVRRWRIVIYVSFAVFIFICGAAAVLYFLQRSELHGAYASPETFLRRACVSAACTRFADLLSQTVNHSANPCSDFYKYACSNLPIGSGILRKRLARQAALNHIMFEAAEYPETSSIKKASLLYHSCVRDTSNADIEAIREFLRGYNLLVGNVERPPVDLLRTMLVMASRMQDGIMLHLGLDFTHPMEQHRRIPSNPLAYPIRLTLNTAFRDWATWLWNNRKAHYSTVVSEVLALVWDPTSENQSFELTAHAIERTEAIVHVRLWKALQAKDTATTLIVSMAEIGNFSTHLNGNLLTTSLSADGRTYSSEMPITIGDHVVLRFLDSVLATDGLNLSSYLSWELARQLQYLTNEYMTNGSAQSRQLSCYLKVEKMLGASATIAYQAFRDVTEEVKRTAHEIFEQIRARSVTTMKNIVPRNYLERDQLHGIVQRLENTNVTIVFPNGFESLEQLDDELSYITVTSSSFITNYLNMTATTWERVKQHGVPDWLLWSRVGTSTIYKPGEQFMVPATYLLFPLFSLYGHLAANWGTFAWPVTEQIWHVLLVEELGKSKSQNTIWYMASVYSRETRCLKVPRGPLDVERIFQATAMAVVEAALKSGLKGMDEAARKEAMQLFFVSSCLPDCGAGAMNLARVSQRCNTAVMNSFAFADAFDCPNGNVLPYEVDCSL